MHSESEFHFSFGNKVWPGLAKLVEELGELQQVLGKIMAYPYGEHPDGTNIDVRLSEEMADVLAAIGVFATLNLTEKELAFIQERSGNKADLFNAWHNGEDVYTIEQLKERRATN